MRKNIINKVSLLILFSIVSLFLISEASAIVYDNGTYYEGLFNISNRMINGTANLLVIGDSINAQTSSPRMFYGYIVRWTPNNWRGIVTQTHSGVSDQGTVITNEPTALAGQFKLVPGANYTWNDTVIRDWNLKEATFYNYTSDANNLATTIITSVTTYANWSRDWTTSANLTGRFIILSSPNGTAVKVRARLKDGTTTAAGGSPDFWMNQSPQGIYYQDINYLAGTGSTATGTILTYTSAVNESTRNAQFYILGSRIYVQNISTGLQLDYAGDGGYTTLSHLTGEYRSLEGVNTLTNYSDETIRRWINATEANTFLIWIGQNSADDEWNGADIRNYSANVFGIIQRYSNRYYEVNATQGKPFFLLVSTYDTSVANTRFTQMSSALLNISQTYKQTAIGPHVEVGFIDLRKIVNETNGTFTNWNVTYLNDGIHPNVEGSLQFSTYIWDQLETSLNSGYGNLTQDSGGGETPASDCSSSDLASARLILIFTALSIAALSLILVVKWQRDGELSLNLVIIVFIAISVGIGLFIGVQNNLVDYCGTIN